MAVLEGSTCFHKLTLDCDGVMFSSQVPHLTALREVRTTYHAVVAVGGGTVPQWTIMAEDVGGGVTHAHPVFLTRLQGVRRNR